jgi:hypothetical protein
VANISLDWAEASAGAALLIWMMQRETLMQLLGVCVSHSFHCLIRLLNVLQTCLCVSCQSCLALRLESDRLIGAAFIQLSPHERCSTLRRLWQRAVMSEDETNTERDEVGPGERIVFVSVSSATSSGPYKIKYSSMISVQFPGYTELISLSFGYYHSRRLTPLRKIGNCLMSP